MKRRSLLLAALPVAATAATLQAPNVVRIDAQLVTSGQPDRASLQALKALGFTRVLHLVPFSVNPALADEPALLGAQGLRFDHVPIPFDAPRLSHLDAVFEVLDDWQRTPGQGLVHCEVNMRASCCAFLWRVLRRREAPDTAWESVTRIWTPRGPWRALVDEALRRGEVRFDPW